MRGRGRDKRARERDRGLEFASILQKVNTQLKRSDSELAKLNSIMEQVRAEDRTFAPNITIDVSTSPKKSQSPLLRKLRQQQGKAPSLPSFLRNPSHDARAGVDDQPPEARPEGHTSPKTS